MNKRVLIAALLVFFAGLQEISINAMLKNKGMKKLLEYTVLGTGAGTLGGFISGDFLKSTWYEYRYKTINQRLGYYWKGIAGFTLLGALGGRFVGKHLFLECTKLGKYLHAHNTKEEMKFVTELINKEYSSKEEFFKSIDKLYLFKENPRYEAFDNLIQFYTFNKDIKEGLLEKDNTLKGDGFKLEAEQVEKENEKIQHFLLIIKNDPSWKTDLKLHELNETKKAIIKNAEANRNNALANAINAGANMGGRS